MVCYAAAVRLGAITSGINLRLGASEVTSILERTRPVVTIVDDGLDAPGRTGRHRAHPERLPWPPPTVRRRTTWPEPTPSDPVAVVWTSGTTGLPKGAVFDHDNLRAVAEAADVLSAAGRPAPVAPALRPRRAR